MRCTRVLVLVGSFALAGTLAGTANAAPLKAEFGDHAASVRIVHEATLNADGTVTASARVRCRVAWEPAELSLHVSQQNDYAEGFTIPTDPCDREWHIVTFTLTNVVGQLEKGRVQISAQYLVTHRKFGDSAGAHDTARGMLVGPYPTQ